MRLIDRIGICILCVCSSFVAKAATTSDDELLRIKKNFSALLIPSDADPFQLKSILVSIPPEQEISDQAVVELHQRYPFDLEKIQSYLSSLSEDGTWPDINYADEKRSGWEPKMHAERILELVKLYCSGQTSYYHSAEVEAVVHKALRYWFTAKPVCQNWWYNQIGIPKTLGTAFVLFEDGLTPEERREAVTVMKNSKFGMTGQNKVWLAGNVMMRALLQNDAGLLKMARDTIASEIVMGEVEGIKDDWSFHQHGAQQQFGNYGLSFVSGMSFFSGVFAGTSLAFDEKQLGIISALIDEGYRWILWKGRMDISSLGRQLFHHAPVHKALSLAFAASELGGGESEQCSSVTQALLKENYGAGQNNSLVGHKHFWQSDYTIHRRPRWMASVKMASDRVVGVEMMNGDNMQGFYMADGATYIYQSGNEYLDIFPLWDWRKVPGVTAFQSDAPVPPIHYYQPRNGAYFVGGISDGKQGVSAMEVDRAGIKARKSWIFTDDFVLCLGADIEANSNLAVATSIEQCHKNGDLTVLQKGKWVKVDGAQKYSEQEQRFFHHGTGYIVWNNRKNCVAGTVQRTGCWHDVMQMYRPQDVTGEVTSIYLEHGVAPRNETYQYLILPAIT
ncbi:MAG: chondroitinase [Bacteroides sp.]|nr:chondroitinase [Bacteroides sp.]